MSISLKNRLAEIGNNKEMWNTHFEIEGENYIYISCVNEFRKVVKQQSGDIAVLVGCMVQGKFFKC